MKARTLRRVTSQQIPKHLHVIWVGEDKNRPDKRIATWKDMHPSWEFTLWGNSELHSLPWRAKKQINIFIEAGFWDGVADLMRYEILNQYGGVYVDANSICVRPLDDWLLCQPLFAIWESEQHRPGLVANGFIGSVPRHAVFTELLNITSRMKKPVRRSIFLFDRNRLRPIRSYEEVLPWRTVGPALFTKMVLPFCPHQGTILPSILFLPKHFLDKEERHSSLIYARHEWGTSHQRTRHGW